MGKKKFSKNKPLDTSTPYGKIISSLRLSQEVLGDIDEDELLLTKYAIAYVKSMGSGCTLKKSKKEQSLEKILQAVSRTSRHSCYHLFFRDVMESRKHIPDDDAAAIETISTELIGAIRRLARKQIAQLKAECPWGTQILHTFPCFSQKEICRYGLINVYRKHEGTIVGNMLINQKLSNPKLKDKSASKIYIHETQNMPNCEDVVELLKDCKSGVVISQTEFMAQMISHKLTEANLNCRYQNFYQTANKVENAHISLSLDCYNLLEAPSFEKFDTVIIRAGHLLNSVIKGGIVSKAILNCNSSRVHLFVTPELMSATLQLVGESDYEIISNSHSTSLAPFRKTALTIKEWVVGDIYIASSFEECLKISKVLSVNGANVSMFATIFDFETKKKVLNDWCSDKIDVLVATPDISECGIFGKRIIFADDLKERLKLSPVELRQICKMAGGRFTGCTIRSFSKAKMEEQDVAVGDNLFPIIPFEFSDQNLKTTEKDYLECWVKCSKSSPLENIDDMLMSWEIVHAKLGSDPRKTLAFFYQLSNVPDFSNWKFVEMCLDSQQSTPLQKIESIQNLCEYLEWEAVCQLMHTILASKTPYDFEAEKTTVVRRLAMLVSEELLSYKNSPDKAVDIKKKLSACEKERLRVPKVIKGGLILSTAINNRINNVPNDDVGTLMNICHEQFLSELNQTHGRHDAKDLQQCYRIVEDLESKNPTHKGKLWHCFRAFKSIAVLLSDFQNPPPNLISLYVEIMAASATNAITLYNRKKYPVAAADLFDYDIFPTQTYIMEGLASVYLIFNSDDENARQKREAIIRRTDIDTGIAQLSQRTPKEDYPIANAMTRKFVIHVGGTNTGKTYQSLQRLQEASSGFYLAPLRLLALEVHETLCQAGIDCGLTTGEEEDLDESNTHISSTVEKMSLSKTVEVAVIDECQMIDDCDRGYAWTRAILGCRAKEIHCCVAPEGLDILEELIFQCGCEFTVEHHDRLVPLTWSNDIVPIKRAEEGDAFICFSRRAVLELAAELDSYGIKASVIYGALPYLSRREQMERFLNGHTKVLVATDAIGMGLNLPIKRIIFTEDEKFDGVCVRDLLIPEIKQISGRAGRFGKYDVGIVCRSNPCLENYKKHLESTPTPIKQARLGYSDNLINIDHPLEDVLSAWRDTDTILPFCKTDVDRQLHILGLLKNRKLSKEHKLKLATIPFNEENYLLLELFMEYVGCFIRKDPIEFPSFLDGLDLSYLETYSKQLDLYYSFCTSFQLPYSKDEVNEMRGIVSTQINKHLSNMRKIALRTCRFCGDILPRRYPYGICEDCYHGNRYDELH